MSDETGILRSRVEYVEVLVGEALALNSKKLARRAREALLLTALRELQAEMQVRRGAPG